MMKLSGLLALLIESSERQGSHYSDFAVLSNGEIRGRRCAVRWERLFLEGAPIQTTLEHVAAFANLIFQGVEEARTGVALGKNGWEVTFDQQGNLNPSFGLVSPLSGQHYRVRCSFNKMDRGSEAALFVRVLQSPQELEALGLPQQVDSVTRHVNPGLLVVTGPTGSGKSSTIASVVKAILQRFPANIVMIEDPIEHVFTDNTEGFLVQRELLVDCPSFQRGVKDAMRMSPDVIVVGECRDPETLRAALRAAESGHYVITSLHAPTTLGALRKMAAYLDGPGESASLAGALVGVIAQRLMYSENLSRNVLIYELLDGRNDAVVNALSKGEGLHGTDAQAVIKALKEGRTAWMSPFSRSAQHWLDKKVLPENALRFLLKDPV
jgi:Tfp pilus assembly pilus retraction ATPase PilT